MKSGSLERGLSEIVIRVCVGPAGCHLEPSMFTGWQRIKLTRGPINMSATLPRELLSPGLSKRANTGATGVLRLPSRSPGTGGIFKDQSCQYITGGRDWAFPFENGSLQAKQSLGRGGGSQVCWVLWLNLRSDSRGP